MMLIPFLYPELFFLMLCFSVYDRGLNWLYAEFPVYENGLYGVRIVVTD